VRSTIPRLLALAAILSGLAHPPAVAQSPPRNSPLTAQSSSGQFLIYGGNDMAATATQRTNGVQLAPSLVAVSCERIKLALLTQMAMPDRWQGRICVILVPAARSTGFNLEVVPFADGWQYRVQVPDRTEPRPFIQAIVRTLLLEMANRTTRERSSEVPFWLAEGLTEEIIFSSNTDLVVDAPTASGNPLPMQILRQRDIGGAGSGQALTLQQRRLASARECLRENPPLTIEQLSWPDNSLGRGVDSPVFRASSHLLVHELLALPGGPAAVQQFVAGLPTRFNWQTAFLQAFASQFDSLRALERWWLLQTVHFTSRSVTEHWSEAESWMRLDEVLLASVQIHAVSNALPARSTVTLQSALQEWPAAAQRALLAVKIQELGSIRLRLATNAVPLADQYRLVLESHVRIMDNPEAGLPRSAVLRPTLRSLARATARKLDVLDAERRAQVVAASRPATVANSPAVRDGRAP
jgi:hypothetical protein